MRIGILVIATGLVLSGCGQQPTFYAAHSYNCCIENTGNLTWHAGQSVALHWQSTPAVMTTDSNRHAIFLSVSLTGPFASVDALKQATSHGSKPAGVRTITAAPVSANDRTVETPASQLDLPADLPPGYYNLGTQAAVGSGSAGGGAIVIVVP
ncbi:MAG TPA: hypothetical protein VHK65_15980 [Candidatus Dormibacteraeota bacterium]|nr:hypothetical protein [Candidatus Dormibacteraeota bacterium]